jgi:hypothetical protein
LACYKRFIDAQDPGVPTASRRLSNAGGAGLGTAIVCFHQVIGSIKNLSTFFMW